MKLTERDCKIIRDISLSHVMCRDQLINLKYFQSATRANTRLRALVDERFLTRLITPFHNQHLYSAGLLAKEVVGDQIAPLLANRAGSPKFLQHALSVTNVRIALLARGARAWRFEQQLWREVDGKTLKPDGLIVTSNVPAFLEVDMGHVTPLKFREKLKTYAALTRSDRCQSLYGFERFRLLIVTTGPRRSNHLSALLPASAGFECLTQTFTDLGIPLIGSWS